MVIFRLFKVFKQYHQLIPIPIFFERAIKKNYFLADQLGKNDLILEINYSMTIVRIFTPNNLET